MKKHLNIILFYLIKYLNNILIRLEKCTLALLIHNTLKSIKRTEYSLDKINREKRVLNLTKNGCPEFYYSVKPYILSS